MNTCHKQQVIIRILFVSFIVLLPVIVHGECTCEASSETGNKNRGGALKLKFGAIGSILSFGAIGICFPLLSKIFPSLEPGNDFFFLIKAFAAGVILATGFIHILPEAFKRLTSPCLSQNPWGNFPFSGFIAMLAAIGTLMMDTVATSYYKRSHLGNAQVSDSGKNVDEEHARHVHVHTHATHGHSHSHGADESDLVSTNLIRHRVISQVLELGIVVHSVIIGVSLGASESPDAVKPLLIALSFHQFFEGMGLGGCISQAKFKNRAIITMAIFFALTTPIGVAIGIGISNVYHENSPTALIVEGCLSSASAGILIYMSLVDLLAADFMSDRIQNSAKLQLQVYIFLLAGVGSMSLLVKWA